MLTGTQCRVPSCLYMCKLWQMCVQCLVLGTPLCHSLPSVRATPWFPDKLFMQHLWEQHPTAVRVCCGTCCCSKRGVQHMSTRSSTNSSSDEAHVPQCVRRTADRPLLVHTSCRLCVRLLRSRYVVLPRNRLELSTSPALLGC
jgi:hypothetical protein